MLKRFLEILARNRVLRRHLPSTFAHRPIFVTPDSALSYAKLDWTASFSSLFTAAAKYVRASDNVWDIGANVGLFSLAAAHLAGPDSEIIALEPDPFLAVLLQKTFHQKPNQDRKLKLVCTAASDRTGIASFSVALRGRSSSGLTEVGTRTTAGGIRYKQYVTTIMLDSLMEHFEAPNVLKIDVEGAEAFVLRGAQLIMRDVRPIFYIEVGNEQNAEVSRIFRESDYRMFDGDSCDQKVIDVCSANTLAVPCESKLTNTGWAGN